MPGCTEAADGAVFDGRAFWRRLGDLGRYLPNSTRLMIDNTYAEFIFCALRIAPVIAMVAVVAFMNRSRLFFLLGFVGCFIGLFFDRGGSTGGHLDHAATRADSFLVLGIIGATIGLITAYAITTVRTRKLQMKTDSSDLPAVGNTQTNRQITNG